MKFEYEVAIIDTGYLVRSVDALNEMGKEGWEAISTTLIREKTIFVLLKRRLPGDEV